MRDARESNIEQFSITGEWTKQSSLLKEKNYQVTDAAPKPETGKEEKITRRVKERLDRNRDGILEIIKIPGTPPAAIQPLTS